MKASMYAVHGNSFFDSMEAYGRVWEQFPQVGIKYDPANWCHHGDDYLEIVRLYGDKISFVHIKEHLYIDGELVSQPAAGMGDIQWGKVMAFLYEHGYDGYLSIEPHGPIWSRGEMRDKMLLLTKKYMGQFLTNGRNQALAAFAVPLETLNTGILPNFHCQVNKNRHFHPISLL